MRRTLLICGIALCVPTARAAEVTRAMMAGTAEIRQCSTYPSCGCQQVPIEPNCEAPPPRAPVNPPQAPPQPPAGPVQAPLLGMFVQPPATGTVQGPVNRSAIEGLGITFPALNLRLPTLHFPSMTKSRTNARMDIDAASAPYIQQAAPPPMAAAMMVPAFAPTMAPYPPSAPTPPAAPTAPQQPPYAPRAPDCEAPRGPQCDAFGNATRQASPEEYAALEAKLRQLEQTEGRIDQKLVLLQESLQRLQVARPHGPPQPPPDNGTMRRLHPPAYVHPQMEQTQGVTPETAPVRYVERPVTYISEPQPLREPQQIFIREPQPPSARIIGVRPALR